MMTNTDGDRTRRQIQNDVQYGKYKITLVCDEKCSAKLNEETL